MVNSTTVVEFTEAATTKLLEVLKEQDAEGQYLRIAVATADNGGIEYVFGLEETPAEKDIIVEGTVKALVDDESAPMLEGSSIDYVEGFERSGFVISNPNFSSGCGCGGGGGGGCGSGGGGGCGSGGGGGCGSGGGGCACGGH
ncbi:MAG: iron-sulfur cluster assembly accessory protein [Chloroflexi bacterium]|jgi:iron-sulfur cluster assembly protein|nr:iron-sulfur cluster assembly accessory protein [Chloroflexota bacterium]MBT5476309.1 iron-sulfur cluster assembly accessory protein [Chloroflexota bacterium]